MTVSPFSIDMYLPAFQKIAQHLGSTTAKVALSLSSYFAGMAIGQFCYGPLLDRFGRKRPIYFGLTLFIVACFGCVFSRTIEMLILARFFQGLGGVVASVGATSMVRDFFPVEERAKIFSRLILVLSISPLFAPTIGGFVSSAWGWQAIFVSLAGIVAFVLSLVIFFLPEGHEPDPTVRLRPSAIMKAYFLILKNRQFATYVFSGSFIFAGLFSYISGSPAIFLGKFHISEKAFGMLFAFLSIGMIGGAQVNVQLLKKFTSPQIFKVASRTQLVVAILFAIGTFLNLYGVAAHILILFAFISCIGLTQPNTVALALNPFPKNTGSASGLMGLIQISIGALAAAGFSLIKFEPSQALAMIFCITSFTGSAIYFFASRKSLNTN